MKRCLLFSVIALITVPMSADNAAREVLEEVLDARSVESPVRYARAVEELARLASEGHSVHQYLIAILSREEDFPRNVVLSDVQKEDYLIKNRIKIKAIAEKNSSALYLLSLETNKVQRLREAIRHNNEYALNDYGVWLIGNSGFKNEKRLKEGFNCFSRAAEKHNSAAIFNLGMCYLNGYGCDRDPAAACENFERAVSMNNPKAMNVLGEMYRDGTGVEKNQAKALEYFSESAAQGNALGQYNYAMEMFSIEGESGTNAVKAVELLEKSARQRNLPAMTEYARCLYESVGIDTSFTNRLRGAALKKALAKISDEAAKRDHQAVAWWYHCAERLKHPPSMHWLATCFMEGRGVEKNERAAVVWYTRAADLRYVPSMLSLARCCEEGVGGLEKSHYNANWWKTRADAERGVRNAKIWLQTHNLK